MLRRWRLVHRDKMSLGDLLNNIYLITDGLCVDERSKEPLVQEIVNDIQLLDTQSSVEDWGDRRLLRQATEHTRPLDAASSTVVHFKTKTFDKLLWIVCGFEKKKWWRWRRKYRKGSKKCDIVKLWLMMWQVTPPTTTRRCLVSCFARGKLIIFLIFAFT